MKAINHEALKELIKVYYKSNQALIITGTFGIGKSVVVRETAKEVAQQQERIFVEWGKLSYEERKEVIANPSKYFVLHDVRLSEYDSSDLKGLPDFYQDTHAIIWKSPYWTKALEGKDSAGFLFFDEMNMAEQSTLKSCFKIFLDRQINEGTISKGYMVLSAGNLDSDRSLVNEIPFPLQDRCGQVELQPPILQSWVDWAIKRDLDVRILAFLQFSPSKLRVVDDNDVQKSTTERGWEMLSDLIKNEDDYKRLELICGSRVGEGVAKEFVAFCKVNDTLKLEKVIQNPQELKKITEISTKYFIVSAVADQYGKTNKVDFNKLLEISQVLDEMDCYEFITLMWRMAIRYNGNKFRKEYSKERNNPLITKYNKYLM